MRVMTGLLALMLTGLVGCGNEQAGMNETAPAATTQPETYPQDPGPVGTDPATPPGAVGQEDTMGTDPGMTTEPAMDPAMQGAEETPPQQ